MYIEELQTLGFTFICYILLLVCTFSLFSLYSSFIVFIYIYFFVFYIFLYLKEESKFVKVSNFWAFDWWFYAFDVLNKISLLFGQCFSISLCVCACVRVTQILWAFSFKNYCMNFDKISELGAPLHKFVLITIKFVFFYIIL